MQPIPGMFESLGYVITPQDAVPCRPLADLTNETLIVLHNRMLTDWNGHRHLGAQGQLAAVLHELRARKQLEQFTGQV